VQVTLSPPANGEYYEPGESFDMTADLFDGAGNRLHEPGELPTYRQYLFGASNGIQYYNLGTNPSAGFFTENRLNLMKLITFGPKHEIEQNYTADHDAASFFGHEVNLPDVGKVVFAGFAPGSTAWDEPIANNMTVEIPEDAVPGTYVAAAKTARSYYGQRLYREEHVEYQVGSNEVTVFDDSVGNCQETCHTSDARLDRLRHGIRDASQKFCQLCHAPPHAEVVGEMIHHVHFYSSKYPVRKSGCALCHLKAGSNSRASIAVCGDCHGEIHPGENMEFDSDRYARCGQTCHATMPEVHKVFDTF
jgi:hypothetical protein